MIEFDEDDLRQEIARLKAEALDREKEIRDLIVRREAAIDRLTACLRDHCAVAACPDHSTSGIKKQVGQYIEMLVARRDEIPESVLFLAATIGLNRVWAGFDGDEPSTS